MRSANNKSKKKENIYRAQTTGLQLAEQNKRQKMQVFVPKQTTF